MLEALAKPELRHPLQTRRQRAEVAPLTVGCCDEADPFVRAGATVNAVRGIAVGIVAARLRRRCQLAFRNGSAIVHSIASIIEKSTSAMTPVRCRCHNPAATMKASIRPHIGSSQASPTRGGTSGWRLSPAKPA